MTLGEIFTDINDLLLWVEQRKDIVIIGKAGPQDIHSYKVVLGMPLKAILRHIRNRTFVKVYYKHG